MHFISTDVINTDVFFLYCMKHNSGLLTKQNRNVIAMCGDGLFYIILAGVLLTAPHAYYLRTFSCTGVCLYCMTYIVLVRCETIVFIALLSDHLANGYVVKQSPHVVNDFLPMPKSSVCCV